ncbi:MAG: hypothetical protein KGI27_09765 [Thaumarchaeota archaeon]|nr:hypothetical protein [Nitrososphaerota archaeon]
MKKLVTVTEVEGEGLQSLLGEKVILLCNNYFYAGTLTGVNETCVQLTDPEIVYETGEWTAKKWANAQAFPAKELYVQTAMIEAFGRGK